MPNVLVTDGEERAALAVVRSLGRAGHRVFVCSALDRSLAGASRHAAEERRVPGPLSEPDACAQQIRELCRAWRIDVLLPVTEASCRAILPHRVSFGSVDIPLPAAEVFKRVSDKEDVALTARELGISVPRQVRVASPDSHPWREIDGFRFPLVVKPSRSVAEGSKGRMKFGVSYAADVDALRDCLRSLPRSAFPVLLQEHISGPGVGVFLLRWDGRILASFAHRRIREKPPSGGVSVYRESILVDPTLLEDSVALLERYDWRGVAMVEYKIDANSGEAYLLEVNGRFWGSLQLAVDAGVDFPSLLLRAALGERVEPVAEYRVGARCRWLWGDVDHMLARVRRRAPTYSHPETPMSRWRDVLEFFVPWRPGERTEVLRLSDPRPFLRETMQWFRTRHG